MEFKYFKGPKDEMGDYAESVRCSLCGQVGEGFELSFATVPSMEDDAKDGKHGCYACLRAKRFEFWHDTDIGMLSEEGLEHVYNHNREPPERFDFEALQELRWRPDAWQGLGTP